MNSDGILTDLVIGHVRWAGRGDLPLALPGLMLLLLVVMVMISMDHRGLESAEQVVGDAQVHLGRWRRTRNVDDTGGVVREGLTAWRATADLAGDEVSASKEWLVAVAVVLVVA